MKPRWLMFAAAICAQSLNAADTANSLEGQAADVIMPVMKVRSTRVERFGLRLQRFVDQSGRGAERLLIWNVPAYQDGFKMLIGGAQVGDEIVSIDGQDVGKILPSYRRQGMLAGTFKIVLKRQIGRRSFQLLELDGRGD